MLYDKLYDWQQKIVDDHKDRPTLGLGLDMGLGKTLVSLALCEAKEITNILIITLATKKTESVEIDGSFPYWMEFYNPELNPTYLLTNLESLYRRDKEAIKVRKKQGILLKPEILDFIKRSKTEPSAIIIDESHKIKTFSSINNRSVKLIKSKMKNYKLSAIYCLSGTPFKRGYEEILTQLQLLGSSMTKGLFEQKYCIFDNRPGLTGWQQPIIGYKNVDEILKIIHKFFITMKSEEVITLPEQVFIKVPIPCSEQFKLFDSEYIKGKPNKQYRNLGGYTALTAGEAYLRSRQLTSGFLGSETSYKQFENSKQQAVRKILEDQPGDYIIFYSYTPELFQLFSVCEELGYEIDIYCGELKSEKFYSEYNPNNIFDTKKRVILANFSSGSTGKNWQKYNRAIFYSIPNYGDWAQALDRIHRIGQKSTVMYYILMMSCWIDYNRYEAIQKGVEYTEAMYEYDHNQRVGQKE